MQTAALIDADDLAALLDSADGPRPVLLDVRYPGPASDEDGRAQYLAGHIPGAAYVDLDTALAAPHVPGVTGRHPLPDPGVFEEAMRAAGVSDDRPVVVYDDWLSIAAARAWWLLRRAGHVDVRVLDGGWSAWTRAGGPVDTGESLPAPGDFRAAQGALRVVDAQGAARIAREGVLLDARPAARFRGEDETIDPVAGHIPGARSLPAASLVDGAGRFLAPPVLAERFAAVGAVAGVEVGVYCGSGIQACHAALAAEASGAVPSPAVYAGSWSEWITDPARGVETGEGGRGAEAARG
ncbi:sulfurtransferase [Actinomyces sp. B33]|uniref:sulfurtransferase n=1 Tax=Actinomyces sp. B33 TaxID=2942131 RepID=UPI0023407E3F|nr:sulfurtransferase [Actinomyces sp. B33]MDC4233935.1 sulfurtransferase [Actinomyces sp. B33]